MADKQKDTKQRKPDIGGQAVLEGVMMKSPDAIAIAVRRPDGKIVVERETYVPLAKKHKWMGWPVLRGIVNMVSMLGMGMSTIEKSSKMLGTFDEEPTKFEKWLSAKLGKSIDKVVMGVAIVMAVALSLLLFMVIPSFIGSLVNRAVSSLLVVNLISGVVRIGILIGYIWLAGLVPDMRRTFEYHGAEHKTVYCYENDLELTPENAQQFSTLHPRCGTSFLLLVMIIAVLLGAVSDQLLHLIFGIGRLTFWGRLLRSLVILPLVSGLSFEALKALAHSDSKFTRALRWPGLQLQRLTTKQPSLNQLEVAIAAFNAALHGLPTEAEAKAAGEVIVTAESLEAEDATAEKPQASEGQAASEGEPPSQEASFEQPAPAAD